jgi:hypothetical protein
MVHDGCKVTKRNEYKQTCRYNKGAEMFTFLNPAVLQMQLEPHEVRLYKCVNNCPFQQKK